MEKKKINFDKSYGSSWARWLFAAIAAFLILPNVIKTIMFLSAKESLSLGTLNSSYIITALIVTGFMVLAVFSSVKGFANKILTAVYVVLPVLAAMYGANLAGMRWYGSIGPWGLIWGSLIAGVLYWLAVYALGMRKLLKAPIYIILFSIVNFVGLNCFKIVYEYTLGRSWGLYPILLLLLAIILWLVVVPFVGAAFKGDEKEPKAKKTKKAKKEALASTEDGADGEKAEIVPKKPREKGFVVALVIRIIGAVAGSVAVILTMVFAVPKDLSPEKHIYYGYVSRINDVIAAFTQGSTSVAFEEYENILYEIDAMYNVLGDKSYTVDKDMIGQNPMLDYISVYAGRKGADRLAFMEECYINGYIIDNDFYFNMLKEYNNNKLTKNQKGRRNEILYRFLKGRMYTGGLPEIDKLNKNIVNILEKEVETISKSMGYAKTITNMKNLHNTYPVGVNRYSVGIVLEKANENPEDFVLNYITIMYYNGMDEHPINGDFGINNDIVQVIDRFEGLYMNTFKDKVTKEEVLSLKKLVMKSYMRALQLEKCADYGLKALETFKDDTFIITNTMYALYEAKRYDECIKLAETITSATNPYPVYYTAISYLGQGKTEASLKKAVELAKLVKESDYPQVADRLLNDYVSTLVVDKQNTKSVYKSLTDSEKQIIEGNEVLGAYVQAYYYTYVDVRLYDNVKAHEAIDKLIAMNLDIAYPHYLKGTITFTETEKTYEEAIEHYLKAAEIAPDDPMIWYMIAVCYERLKDWEKCYLYADRATSLSAWNDYYNDYEGKGIHMWSLRDRAKGKLKREQDAMIAE